MRDGVGFIAEAATVASIVGTGLSVASFFGGGKKKKPQITAAENRHMYEQSAIKSVNATMEAIKRQIEKHTHVYQVEAEGGRIYPKNFDTAIAKSRKKYTATFGASMAEPAVQNLSSWIKPIYMQAEGIVEDMKKERIAQILGPAKAAEAAQEQLFAEQRFAQSIAYAIEPREPTSMSGTTMLLIVGGIAAVWLIMKGT